MFIYKSIHYFIQKTSIDCYELGIVLRVGDGIGYVGIIDKVHIFMEPIF